MKKQIILRKKADFPQQKWLNENEMSISYNVWTSMKNWEFDFYHIEHTQVWDFRLIADDVYRHYSTSNIYITMVKLFGRTMVLYNDTARQTYTVWTSKKWQKIYLLTLNKQI